ALSQTHKLTVERCHLAHEIVIEPLQVRGEPAQFAGFNIRLWHKTRLRVWVNSAARRPEWRDSTVRSAMNGYSLIVSADRAPVKRRNPAAGPSNGIPHPDHLTTYRPPGASLVWAGLFRVLGHRYEVIRLTHCLMAAISSALV